MSKQARWLLICCALLITACAPIVTHHLNIEQAIQSARTKEDHEALAARYEQEAKALQEKVEHH